MGGVHHHFALRRDLPQPYGGGGISQHHSDHGYGLGVRTLITKEGGQRSPLGEFGWDGAAGSSIIMDTKSKTSVVYAQHVRNCSWVYIEVHPKLRDMVFGEA